MILLVTRPPLHDDEYDPRAILRSNSIIEGAVFEVLQGFLTKCDRAEVILHPKIDLGDYEDLRAVHFRINQGGRVRFLDMKQKEVVPDDPQFTVGYHIGIPEVPGIGARLTVVFGMGGTETLWLCHLLRIGLAQEFYETISTTKTRFQANHVFRAQLRSMPDAAG